MTTGTMATPRDEAGYSSSEEALGDSILSLGNSDSSTNVSSVESFDIDDDNTTNARHVCLTEPKGYSDVRIGYDDEITRWIKGQNYTMSFAKRISQTLSPTPWNLP